MRRKLAAGNWKMNGMTASLTEAGALHAAYSAARVDILLCPPATLLSRMSERLRGSAISTGAQDCHPEPGGAHTGDLSAAMLADSGASAVIVGHSERRTNHGETDADVLAKAEAAAAAGLASLICVGETEAERDAGKERDIVGKQLAGSVPEAATGENTVIAYEPVWAIGTGRVPSMEQIADMHGFIRETLTDRFGSKVGDAVRLLYGGSVKASNAAEIFAVPNVDGALVGGASLTAADFSPIISALELSK